MCTVALNVASALTSVFTGIQSAQYEKALGQYKSNLLISQANEMKQKASEQYQKGIEEARKERLNSILKMGTINTKAASGNLALSSELTQNALSDEKQIGELNALNAFENYKKRSDSYLQAAQNYYNNAALTSFAVKKTYKNNMFSSFKKGLFSLSNNFSLNGSANNLALQKLGNDFGRI